MNFHEDDRAQRLFDIFPKVNGQINVSYVNSTEHIVAWHKHNIQSDYWTCLKGSFKVGMAIPNGDGTYEVKWEYLSDKNPRVIEMVPGVYHGYKALEPNSILLYYLTEKWTPDDEEKVSPGYFGEKWETENK
tara:strand:+ start:2048 stop:2443 length:396 start_codon:yes stop_codon:yes gene_type:complete